MHFLWEMLYQSIFVSADPKRPSKTILDNPNISKYLEDWGREGDKALIAIDLNDNPIGAIWIRLFDEENKGYGYIDDKTPELGMAVLPEHRGQGVGSMLLEEMLNEVKRLGYQAISLSVDPKNPATRLYDRYGFNKVGVSGTSQTMSVLLE